MPTEIIDVAAAALRLNVSTRRVRLLCENGRIHGARKVAGSWIIVADVDRKGKIRIEVAPPAKPAG